MTIYSLPPCVGLGLGCAGGYHNMVIKPDGSVWATGSNEYGQLGDESAVDKIHYVQTVSNGVKVKVIAADSRHSMMVKYDGSVWTTGYNDYGQLGDDSKINKKCFVQVMSDGGTIIAAATFHNMVLKEDGSLWVTGTVRTNIVNLGKPRRGRRKNS